MIPKVKTSIRIDAEDYAWLEKAAKLQGKPTITVIQKALSTYIQAHKEKDRILAEDENDE